MRLHGFRSRQVSLNAGTRSWRRGARASSRQRRRETLAQLAQVGFFRPQDFLGGFDPSKPTERIEENWRLPGPMRLSHLCLESNDGKCVGRLVDWQEALSDPEDDNARLAKMRVVTHV